MKRLRFSFAGLMVLIGIIAVDLAAGRFLWGYEEKLPLGVMPGALVMQFGVFRLIRSQKKAFWAGFVTFGSLAVVSFAWATIFGNQPKIAPDPLTGRIVVIPKPGSFGGDQMQAIWNVYGNFAGAQLERWPFFSDPNWSNSVTYVAIVPFWLLPQLLIALLGGLMAVVWWRRQNSVSMPDEPLRAADRLPPVSDGEKGRGE